MPGTRFEVLIEHISRCLKVCGILRYRLICTTSSSEAPTDAKVSETVKTSFHLEYDIVRLVASGMVSEKDEVSGNNT